jgi:alkylation response protein AidB-like acyl-CoA dehydrogenase
MPEYRAPLREQRLAMTAVGGLPRVNQLARHRELTEDLVDGVLEEAARFAERELAPLYRSADREGAILADGRVRTAAGMAAAYAEFIRGGWIGVAAPAEHGGQALPNWLAVPVSEIWRGANLSFALCTMLTQAAIEALARHGNASLQSVYLPKLVSGEWTATMNLTEPQAGSDLAAISTLAVPEGDHFRVRGKKIFITWGDHDLTDNIVHLVLARTPGSEPGVKGISMFLVPKHLPTAARAPGERNDVRTVSLEHKLGIRGSPTCVLSYGESEGAVGYLVGALGDGLACMFTMMNRARVAVGVEALGVAERAYQQARTYARERVQGVPIGERERAPIVRHPDVRRMLLTMKAALAGMRGLAYSAALAIDEAEEDGDGRASARAALLTPIVKGWCSEIAQEVASMALQVHGGAGYIEETGAAQPFRDVRITTIYEGTTGIQASDFVRRKLAADGGAAAADLLREIEEWLREAGPVLAPGAVAALERAVRLVQSATRDLLAASERDPAAMGTASVYLLLAYGTVLGGWHVARQALAAGAADAWGRARAALLAVYVDHLLPRVDWYVAAGRAGSASVMDFPLDEL